MTVPRRGLFQNFLDGHFRTFRFPRGVGSVAPVTAEIAAGGADKDGGNSSEKALSLDGVEDFRNSHQDTGAGLGGMAGVFT